MLVIMETLEETWIRPKNEITVPRQVRNLLNLAPKDGIRWILCDNGEIVIKKIVSKIVNNKNMCGKNNNGEREDQSGEERSP
jgi:bifunctional DNA-binding transcriptional regulator/antitoxin component of YhaV-PrlF toxin-antitoxin module